MTKLIDGRGDRRRRRRIVPAVAAALGLALLAGCGGGKSGSILGIEKQVPDEFAVVSRAPLTLPPDYGLRPPDPEGARSQDIEARQSAQEALFGRDAAKRLRERKETLHQQGASPGEIALLERTGALQADPDIRRIVEEETKALAQERESFVDDLVFWREQEPDGDVVDAEQEQRRLQENAALGREVTEGDTPTIRREDEEPLLEWPF